MKPFVVFILTLCLSLPTQAAEWGILPLPQKSDVWAIQDYIDGLNMVKNVGAPIHVSVNTWAEMEPSKKRYDMDKPLGGLSYSSSNIGLTPYLTISLINTVKRDMPKDLMKRDWRDPEILKRFDRLMAQIKTKIPATLPTLGIGNEVDSYFEKNPGEVDAYLSFYRGAREIVRKYYPNTKVGIVVTYEGLVKGRAPVIEKMVAASDAAFFTFYPLIDMKPQPLENIPNQLRQLVSAAQGKDIYLQEVGYPSAGPGVSPQSQADFYKMIIPTINAIPQIKVASIFLLHDMSPKLCAGFTQYYGFGDAPKHLTAPFEQFLCSLGVRTYDGQPKPAWIVIEEALKKSRGRRI